MICREKKITDSLSIFTGLIYDLTLSWELAFYLAGGWIVVSGVLISFIQLVKNYQEKPKNLHDRSSLSSA